MKSLFFTSLRARIVALVLIALLPALFMILYTASEERRMAISEIKKNALMTGQLVASEDEQFFEGARHLLLTLALLFRNQGNISYTCQDFLPQLLKQFPDYENIGITRLTGEIVCSAAPILEMKALTKKRWFKRIFKSHVISVGDFHMGGPTGKSLLILAYPITGHGKKSERVAFVIVDPLRMIRYYSGAGILLPGGSTLKLVDRNGNVLVSQPDPGVRSRQVLKNGVLLNAIRSQKAVVLQSRSPDGVLCLYAVAPVPSRFKIRQISVIFKIPKDIAFADSNRIVIHNLILLGIVATFTIVMAWIGGHLFILRQVKALVASSKQIAAGDFKARTDLIHGKDELGLLARAFDEMASLLEQREQERQEAEESMRNTSEQLRNLSLHLQTVREEEDMRVAREIHDNLGQALTALKMDLFWLMKKIPDAEKRVLRKIASMSELIDTTIETVQKISTELRPGILDDIGLPAAIEWLVDEFQKRTNINVEIVTNLSDNVWLSKNQSTAVFRIFQEILTNVMRHAQATKVTVSLEEVERTVILRVEDNGRGITEREIHDPSAYGIIGMKERVHPWNGDVSITGVPGKGTTVIVTIPMHKGGESS